MSLLIRPLGASERGEWEPLARAYKDFYQTVLPDTAYDGTWRRLTAGDGIRGLGARLDGRLVGIAHYLYHTGIWAPRACYLEDLFVAPAARGQGVARALIEAIAQQARADGAGRLYWLTHETNATARMLYDRVARYSGFVEYEYPMDA
ncbi:MAG TPA: GNAT family N-acetyltransferase [Steroidobacteraceae bacterium]|nr:GNAT family N-acetyltransferase [Steroidobacteraceae bacterium]